MSVLSTHLKDLSKVIGWRLVNDDKGFSTYEFEIEETVCEHILHVVRILDDPNELEVLEILYSLIKVLPFKLKAKINKLISKVKAEDFPSALELISFTVEEYKKKAEYTKLREYGLLLGMDIANTYEFQYKLKRRKRAEILSKIEVNLPMELAPVLGRIKKVDYKIAYIRSRKNLEIED